MELSSYSQQRSICNTNQEFWWKRQKWVEETEAQAVFVAQNSPKKWLYVNSAIALNL